jgi:hypothetical protein
MHKTDKKQEAKIEFINEKSRLGQTTDAENLPIQSVKILLEAAEIVQEIMDGKL